MDPKNYKYNKEEFGGHPTNFPNALCHRCLYKQPDFVSGKTVVNGAEKSKCQKFEHKDFNILKGGVCPQFKSK